MDEATFLNLFDQRQKELQRDRELGTLHLLRNKRNQVEYPTGAAFSPLSLIKQGLKQFLRDDSEMTELTGAPGLREGVLYGAALPASVAIPGSLGVGALTRAASGAGLNTAASLPFYVADPETADPLMDAAMGAGAGLAGLPGAIAGGILGYSPESEAAGAGGTLKLLKRLFRNDPSALQRLSLLAQEAPSTFRAYDPAAIADVIRTTDEGMLSVMRPSEFLGTAVPMSNRKHDDQVIGALDSLLRYDTVPDESIMNSGGRYKRRVPRGLDQIPHLSLAPEEVMSLDYTPRGDLLKATGHEGRHGTQAVQNVFGDSPIMVQLRQGFRSPDNFHDLLDYPVFGIEGADRTSIRPTPKRFAGGGRVVKDLSGVGKRLAKHFFGNEEEKQVANIIKEKGGNWLPSHSSMPVSNLDQNIEQLQGSAFEPALKDWVGKTMRRYVTRDLGTASDPVRKLIDSGTTHLNDDEFMGEYFAGVRDVTARGSRQRAGMPENPISVTEAGKNWERRVDGDVVKPGFFYGPGTVNPAVEAANPWISKTDPDKVHQVYDIWDPDALNNQLGFEHIIDELNNSLRADSGLPPELQLKPDDLKQLGMDKAVSHVAKINKWREANRMDADFQEFQGMPVFKDYPEDGMRWVELKGKDRDTTQRWLSSEGDAMGHCVGGYCDDVENGVTRILSLRDSKGQPHVTIELGSGLDTAEGHAAVGDRVNELGSAAGIDFDNDPEAFDEYINLAMQQISEEWAGAHAPVISQIKGKGNARPVDKYQPYIADLIQNHGPWHSIEDLANTELIRHNDRYLHPATGKMYRLDPENTFFPPELGTPWMYRKAGFPITGEHSAQDLQDFVRNNEEAFRAAASDYWKDLTTDPKEIEQYVEENVSGILGLDLMKAFSESKRGFAAGGMVEDAGFQNYLKALGGAKATPEEWAFYKEYTEE